MGLKAEADFAGRQSVGTRSSQQDAYGVVPPEDLGGGRSLMVIVADGMGGHAAGDIASETLVEAFADGFFSAADQTDGSRLWSGLELANSKIGQIVMQRPDLRGMGTTVTAVLFRENGICWISVGDSPLYLFRDGGVRRLNTLHIDLPSGTPPQTVAASGSVLASAVIGERIFEVDEGGPLPLLPGDLVVIASDGLNTLSEGELLGCVNAGSFESAALRAKAFIGAVESRRLSAQDNTTVVVVNWR